MILSHLLLDYKSEFYEIYLGCSPSGLVVHLRFCFRCVVKMAAIGHLGILLLSHLLCNQLRNFVEILHMDSSQPHALSPGKRFRSIVQYGQTSAIFDFAYFPLLNTVMISLLHLLLDYKLKLFETCLGCSSGGLVVHLRFWFRCVIKYGRHRPSCNFVVIISPP